jgi:Homeodomain-like domain
MPEPQAAPIHVSALQLDILEHMIRRTTSAQRLVKRAQIILDACKGTSNTKISQHQHVDYETVRRWRDRW